MEESQSAEKLGAPSWLVYEILLYSSFFFLHFTGFRFQPCFLYYIPGTEHSEVIA